MVTYIQERGEDPLAAVTGSLSVKATNLDEKENALEVVQLVPDIPGLSCVVSLLSDQGRSSLPEKAIQRFLECVEENKALFSEGKITVDELRALVVSLHANHAGFSAANETRIAKKTVALSLMFLLNWLGDYENAE